MAEITIKVDTGKLEGYTRDLQQRIGEITFAAVVNASPILRDEIKSRAPCGRTGQLAGSVTIERQPDRVLIGPTVDYAPYVVRGTRPSPGRYIPAIEKRLVSPAHPSFGEHPGIKPNPFIEQAVLAGSDRFLEQVRQRIRDFLLQTRGRVITG